MKIKIFKKYQESKFENSSDLFFVYLAQNNEVVKLKSNKNYTNIYFKNGSVKSSSYTLMRFEKMLKDNFRYLRINRSTIINIPFVREYNHKKNYIVLESDECFSVSRRRYKSTFYHLNTVLNSEDFAV